MLFLVQTLKKILSLFAIFVFAFSVKTYAQVTAIYTDFNGFWGSSRRIDGAVNSTRPDNSHNLLAFRYRRTDGITTTYSTGVDDSKLTSANGVTSFTAGDYRALPIAAVASPASGTYAGLGQLYDGVNNGFANPAPPNNIPFYLTDGVKGLNLGTGIYNLPAGNISFNVSNFQIPEIGDSIPDIVITQIGVVDGTPDTLSFRNAAGQVVGNPVVVRLSNLDTLGLATFDFYTASSSPMVGAGTSFINSGRALRFFAADLSLFGLNSTNVLSVTSFVQRLNGSSDVAFVAYNAKAIKIVPDNIPGCSSVPGLWMKANSGTNTITENGRLSTWDDRSQNAFTLEQATDSRRPFYKTGSNVGFNFNPYINFDPQNILTSPNGPFGTSVNSNADFFIVGRPTNTTAGKNKILGFSRSGADVGTTAQGDFPSLAYNQAGNSAIDNAQSPTTTFTGTSTNLNNAYIWRANYTQNSAISFFKNGVADGSGGTALPVGIQSLQMGDASPGNELSDFDIAELIVFPQNLSVAERNRVQTYLAIKYGITLNHNYESGAGATVWNMSTASAYNNNIFGIGREDCQGLYQKQSKSQAAGGLVTIGNNSSIVSENTANITAMTNATFSIMGDNAGALSWQTTEMPTNIQKRIGREWRVVETGSVTTLLLQVPASTSSVSVKLPDPGPANCNMYLLVDNDGDFSSGIIATIPMTLNGTNWEASYNFTSGNYYTFATANRDYGDLPVATWPSASATINGCDVDGNGYYDRFDNNSSTLVWAGTAVNSDATGSFATVESDLYDDGFDFPSIQIAPTYTYSYNVYLNSNKANTTVHYRLWFDWDNNGSFANDVDGLGNPATYAGSAVVGASGPTTVTVNAKTPAAVNRSFKVRLMVSDAAISDEYRLSSPSYVYSLANGEVEDYQAPFNLLPVKLASFNGTIKDCMASLVWQTASEENAAQFIVEQSSDGVVFSNVGSLAARNLENGSRYTCEVKTVFNGKNYFRLKMLDKDGSATYSEVLQLQANCNTSRILVQPNPVQNILQVTGAAVGDELLIIDATGKQLQRTRVNTSGVLSINMQAYPNGFYTLKLVSANGRSQNVKFVKGS